MADLPNAEDLPANASPAETKPGEPETTEGVSSEGRTEAVEEGETDEEKSMRYRKLSADKKRLALENAELKRRLDLAQSERLAQARLDEMKTRKVATPYQEQEVETAFRTLKDRGMMTREEGEAMFNELQKRVNWDFKHRDNERDINRRGSNLPHYERDEVEAYANEHGLSDPLAAYRDMYFDEITDALKKSVPRSTSKVATMRPSRPVDQAKEGLTLESLKEKLAGPDGRAYYEQMTREDPHKLDELIKSLS
jgi:hypothetical protein